jgi:uncharacterized protein involved in exopolysaccharide biosynthesis
VRRGVLDSTHDDEIDLIAAARTLIAYRYLLIATTVVCAGIALYFALTAVPMYKAEVVTTQALDLQSQEGGSLGTQLNGLMGLVGINNTMDRSGQNSEAVLESRHLVEEFIVRNNLLPELYPHAAKPPTLWRAVRAFQRNLLSIRQDTRKGTTTVSLEWSDPQVAARWANGFVALANEVLRKNAIEESQRNIAYLEAQTEHTTDMELKRVTYNLIENETKTLMLANGRPEYAFRIVDPAVAPEIRSSPRRTLMLTIGIASGLFLGAVIALTRDYVLRRERQERETGTEWTGRRPSRDALPR